MEGGSQFLANMQAQCQQPQTNDQRILVLSKEGSKFFKIIEKETNQISIEQDKEFPEYPCANIAKFTPNSGTTAVIIDELGIHLVDTRQKKERLMISKHGIGGISFSPLDTYLVTCEKYHQGEKNLMVWNIKTGKEEAQFEWKKSSKEGPKTLKFTKDEAYMARLALRNQIDIFHQSDLQQPKYKLIATKDLLLNKKSKSMEKPQSISQSQLKFDGFEFIPQNPQIPSHLSPIYFATWQNAEGLTDEQMTGNVYIFDLQKNPEQYKFKVECSHAQEIQVKSSPTGYAILVWSQNFVDTSGKSYYGEHCVQYVQISGGKNRSFVPVFDGQIHDLQWLPSGEHFISISGTQPATATLYDKDCKPIFEFGKRYRNTIKICPFAQLLLVGGFGNLAGEVDYWDLNQRKEVGKTKAYCSVSQQWCPNGKYILSSVLHERVKVDNEIKFLSPNGQTLTSLSYKESELYDAQWQPYAAGTFQKPDLSSILLKEEVKEQAKPAKRWYKPPGGENSAFSQIMRMEMAKTNEKGPRQLDQDAYKDLVKEQAQMHAEIIGSNKPSSYMGDAQWSKSYGDLPQNAQDSKQLSKHAKRRARKKQRQQDQGQ